MKIDKYAEWIKVPEGMVAAVDAAISNVRGVGCDLTGGQVRDIALTEALRWLYNEMDGLERKPYDDAMAHEYNRCIADVRRMFRVPEPEVPSEPYGPIETLNILLGEIDRVGVTKAIEVLRQEKKYE